MKYKDYLKFAKKLIYKKGSMPLYFVFFITERCLASCRHCLLGWKEPNLNELSLEEIDKFSSTMDDILFLLLTGGDPFLREDLVEIVRIFYKNNKVRNLGMPTNGSTTDRVVQYAERILKDMPDLDFAIDISIDDIGERHNYIRRFEGLFEKAIYTYKELEKLTHLYPKFNLNVAVTVSYFNQDHLMELYDYLKRELKVKTINQLLTRGKPREPIAKNVDINKYLHFSLHLDKDTKELVLSGYHSFPFSDFVNAMKNIRQKIIYKIIKENKYQVPCYAGTLSAVMYANGDLFPCELLDKKIGNIRDVNYDFKNLWFSPQLENIRRWIKNSRCFCTYECFLTNSILFTPHLYPWILYETLAIKFSRLKNRLTNRNSRKVEFNKKTIERRS